MVFWLTVGGSVLFGFVVGRWWALLVPPVLTVLLFNAESKPGNDLAGLVFVWGAFAFIGVLVGVIVRQLLSTSSDQPSHPPDSPVG